MIVFGDLTGLLWVVPALLMSLLWIRTPVFITASGKRILGFLKLTILLLLAVALLDPKIPTQTVHETSRVVFALDVSPSVAQKAKRDALRSVSKLIATFPRDVEARVVAFDRGTTIVNPVERRWKGTLNDQAIDLFLAETQKSADSDLGSALGEAFRQVPAGQRGRIILLSDGRDNHGTVGREIETIADGNIPVSVLPLDTVPPSESPVVLKTNFPDQVFVGEETKAQLLISFPAGGPINIEVNGTDGTVQKQQVSVPPGLSAQTVSFKAAKVGTVVFTIKVADSRAKYQIARMFETVRVKPIPKVLVFENNEGEGQFLREALAAEKIEFASCTPSTWPRNFKDEIRKYPCVVLNNIPRAAFKDTELQEFKEAVQDGTGLMMLGGPNSFGMGEWTDTPVEEVMPVKMPRRTVNAGLALILVLDCSGSMNGRGWQYLLVATKEILKLCKGQHVGIVLFNHLPYWVLTLQQIEDPDAVGGLLDRCFPNGGTIYSLPLVQSIIALRDQPFPMKNVIMLSDGVPADFPQCEPLFDDFRNAGIKVTTVAAGYDCNEDNLETIARETGGEFYRSLDFADLPNVFKKEFKRISGPPYIEEAFQPVLSNSTTIARGISQEEIPFIEGLVVTQKKPAAALILTSNRGDPVMAYWRYGLGRTVAFTSDLLPNWTKSWAGWNGFGKLLRQTVKDLCSGAKEKFAVSTVQKGSDVSISVNPGPELKEPLRYIELEDAGRQRKTYMLNPDKDGRYMATPEKIAPGIYTCGVFTDGAVLVGASLVAVNESREYMPGRVNNELLRSIADKTGGEILDSLDQMAGFSAGPAVEATLYLPLWPWLAILALLLYLLDIYLRKANVFGIKDHSEMKGEKESSEEIYLQLANKFSNMAEEHSLKGESEDAKRYYLRAKAFYMKAQATKEANRMWERFKRFEN